MYVLTSANLHRPTRLNVELSGVERRVNWL